MKKRLLQVFLFTLLGIAGSSATAMAQSQEQNEVVEIATAADLNAFAQAIENGENVDGLLTADIDLRASDYPDLMIGSESGPFYGTFDGGGHKITYHYEGACLADKWRGLFRTVEDATIRNLRVEGEAFPTNIHFGALIGVARGTVLVENVVTTVDVTGQRSGVTGDAGMLGANYADITFNNCAVLGPLGNPGSSMYSPFSGWSNGSSSVTLNNCYAACYFKEGTGIDGNSATLSHGGTSKNYFNNCYYLNFIDKIQGTQITQEQITSGSLCYKLNGDQSDIVWTQTIGVDPYPMPNPDGKRVYASGTCRCDGAELEDNPLTYTNTESYPVIPPHDYGVDGICVNCGMADPNAVKQNEDGFYLIENADQMYWLNLKVQEGNGELKVLLTDDINLDDGLDPDLMIGTEARPFTGIFDGGGHTITYDYVSVEDKWRGLFAFVKDATIRNLYVEGRADVTNIHYGALIGRGDGTILVENVVTNVDITGLRAGVTGDAGMIGANYADITFNNCATLGEMGYEGSSMYSPFSGWSDGKSSTTLNNCYSTCMLTEGTGTGNCFTLTHPSGTVTINNSYYLNVVGTVISKETIHQSQITEEQIESGELCYLLNGDQTSIGWYQTLSEDELPLPFDTHLRVYGAGETFMNITDDNSFMNFVSLVIEEEKERYGNTIAQKSLIETYLEALDNLSTLPDIDAFMAGYNELADQRQAIQSCAEAYAAYVAKVEETTLYLQNNPDLNNEKVEQLKTYLTEFAEPNNVYPNGSAEYILDNCLLSEEEIKAETALIDIWLAEAISYKPAIGTDVSVLFTNLDLSEDFSTGWEGTYPTGRGTSETSPLYAAECLATTMDMYQTVSGLENGIYELQVNGAFRPTPYDDFWNVNYAATLYANGVHNYFQANIEDMIAPDAAIDGENCNITGSIADFAIIGEDGNVIGYTMQGIVSCCNAFQAGRYPNSILCKVTDGTLTIGIRQPGTGLTRDWLGFGGIKVYYYGQLNEAGESLDRVLKSQSDRAKTILNVYENSIDYTDNYATYPNYSKALKDELKKTLDAVATTTEPEAKYQLIEKFSSLFLQIYECKQAYITLMDKAEELSGLIEAFKDLVSEDEFYRLEDLYFMLTDGYTDGTLSAEEALAIDIKEGLTFIPDEEDGYYLLGNDKDFFVFASMVGGGQTQINAKLIADINLRESEDYGSTMIGKDDAQFAGTFDGQGHAITYMYEGDCVADKWRGLFRAINGATIRNLRVEGEAYPTNIHFGALIGVAYGTVLVENVVTNVDVTGQSPTGVQGDAGMLGANYADITFNNCAVLGPLGNPGSSMYSPFSGWSNGSSSVTLNNCYAACYFKEGTGIDGNSATLSHGGTSKNYFNNCYYLNYIDKKQGKQMPFEKFQSGEVCYKLNGDQSVINWYQTICEDDYPMPFDTHSVVLYSDQYSYYNLTNDGPVGIVSPLGETKEGATIFNLQGQRLSKMQKGINIVNGKKLLVK